MAVSPEAVAATLAGELGNGYVVVQVTGLFGDVTPDSTAAIPK
jgi:hypothetical protein